MDWTEMNWAEKVEYMVASRRKCEKLEQMSDLISHNVNFISADNEKQEYIVEFKIEKWMENPRNELHGGVCCTFFDTTTAIASLAIAQDRRRLYLFYQRWKCSFSDRYDGTCR